MLYKSEYTDLYMYRTINICIMYIIITTIIIILGI